MGMENCSSILDLNGTAPCQVHLVPSGSFQGRDGRGPYHLNASSVLASFAAWGMPVAIDYEHQSLNTAANGQPAPAAGWITELKNMSDGIWGKVEWTEKAVGMITLKEYRYLSPVFDHKKDGEVVRLTGAALTNNPNLYLQALATRHTVARHFISPSSINESILVADAVMRSGLLRQDQVSSAAHFHASDPKGFDTFLCACRSYQKN